MSVSVYKGGEAKAKSPGGNLLGASENSPVIHGICKKDSIIEGILRFSNGVKRLQGKVDHQACSSRSARPPSLF